MTGAGYSKPVESRRLPSRDPRISAYTFRYDSPSGGIAQVIVNFSEYRGCDISAVTFYDSEIDLDLNWLDTTVLEVRYPNGRRFDHPPWGTDIRCVGRDVQVRMRPTSRAAKGRP